MVDIRTNSTKNLSWWLRALWPISVHAVKVLLITVAHVITGAKYPTWNWGVIEICTHDLFIALASDTISKNKLNQKLKLRSHVYILMRVLVNLNLQHTFGPFNPYLVIKIFYILWEFLLLIREFSKGRVISESCIWCCL